MVRSGYNVELLCVLCDGVVNFLFVLRKFFVFFLCSCCVSGCFYQFQRRLKRLFFILQMKSSKFCFIISIFFLLRRAFSSPFAPTWESSHLCYHPLPQQALRAPEERSSRQAPRLESPIKISASSFTSQATVCETRPFSER